MKSILVADIGGTNSRFAYFSYCLDSLMEITNSVWIETQSVSSFSQLLNRAEIKLGKRLREYDYIVIAIAGPVEKGTYCNPPNIDWDLDLRIFESEYECAQPLLINDFVAQAFVSQTKFGQDAQIILDGEPDPFGAVATVGAGTGFGKVVVVRNASGLCIVNPSEGGHSNAVPETRREFEFCSSLSDELGGVVTWDDVLSGVGLMRIHKFLYNEDLLPEQIAIKFSEYRDTLDWFSSFLGRACRNFALDTLSTGGLYIAGGIVAQNPQIATNPKFATAFRNSRDYGALLSRIPVRLISDRDSGLWGGALYALNVFK